MQANAPRSSSTVSSTAPPSATRTQRRLGTSAYQTAPVASTQIPSGTPSPSAAQTRRPDSVPSAAMSQAESRFPYDSASTSVPLSALTATPFGNARPSATGVTLPSGRTSASRPGAYSAPGEPNGNPSALTYAFPRPSTTMSFQGGAATPDRSAYGSSGPNGSPASSRASCPATTSSRPSGRKSKQNGSAGIVAATSFAPSAPTARIDPAPQSETYSRPSCHRGDSPIAMPSVSSSITPPPGLSRGCRGCSGVLDIAGGDQPVHGLAVRGDPGDPQVGQLLG